MIVDQGICRIAVPKFAVFAIQTKNGIVELVVNGLVANVGIGSVPWCCLSSLVWTVFVLLASGTASRFLCTSSDWILWGWFLGESNVENGFPKTFSCTPLHASSGNHLSQLSRARELGIIARWLETWDNLPLWFDPTSWNSPESFMEFICSCICCNCEVSFCIVSWFSLNFCTETSSTRSSCVLLICHISCMLRIWVSRKTFSLIDNSSCRRTCCRRHSTYPCCASYNSNLCSSVCRCSSPMHLLRDSTWSSCFARSDLAWLSMWSLEEILSNSTG